MEPAIALACQTSRDGDFAEILHYGVSVEKVEEALKATEYAGIATVQIIFNSPE